MYEKLRMLVKPVEFALMVGLPILGVIFGGVSILWAAIIAVVYVVLQLTGWGVKHVQDAIDGGKGIVEDVKEGIEKVKK